MNNGNSCFLITKFEGNKYYLSSNTPRGSIYHLSIMLVKFSVQYSLTTAFLILTSIKHVEKQKVADYIPNNSPLVCIDDSHPLHHFYLHLVTIQCLLYSSWITNMTFPLSIKSLSSLPC